MLYGIGICETITSLFGEMTFTNAQIAGIHAAATYLPRPWTVAHVTQKLLCSDCTVACYDGKLMKVPKSEAPTEPCNRVQIRIVYAVSGPHGGLEPIFGKAMQRSPSQWKIEFRHVYCTVGGPSWSKMVIQSQGGICLFCRVLRKALFTTSLHSLHCRERS